MNNAKRFPSRHALRAGLIATLASFAPAVAQTPERPVRLPPVQNTAQATAKSTIDSTAPQQDIAPLADSAPDPAISSSQVKARLAAMRTVAIANQWDRSAAPKRWLPTTTAAARLDLARQHLADASRAFDAGAWLSAEASAWEALRWAAEATDLSQRESGTALTPNQTATAKLREARQAIIEARDFARWSGPSDPDAIARTARSHSTTVLHDTATDGLTATEAADRYLDSARVALSRLAAANVEAAQVMDLLAATLLTRNEAKQLPASTALCLRRAALQGQPMNASLAFRLGAQLADTGLLNEAEWALQHSLSMQPSLETASTLASVLRRSGQGEKAEQLLTAYRYPTTTRSSTGAPKIPQIIQLSPEQFAAVSKPVIANPANQPNRASEYETTPQVASLPASQQTETKTETAEDDEPGRIRRFFGSLRRVW